ncbi:MAG: DoxX family protein [Nannocystaceae bacterium]|nr:DoxX family protein [Nannocystaceae bacterium]
MVGRESRLIVVLRVLLGVGMVAQGINHFVLTDLMIRIMPGYLPWHRPLVLSSGIAELALGLMVFIPKTRHLAGWGLVALLVAVFPANIEMAIHASNFPELPELALWLRLPLQPLLVYWVWVTCLRRPAAAGTAAPLQSPQPPRE